MIPFSIPVARVCEIDLAMFIIDDNVVIVGSRCLEAVFLA